MKEHTSDELEMASDYLEFIIHMAEDDLRNLNQMPVPTFPRNVYIDSILIRLRSLIEFLCASDTKFDTDVIARHYIEDFELPEEDSQWLNEQKRTIDTALAHLTKQPMPKQISEVEFPYRKIYIRVMEGLNLFFDAEPRNVLEQTKIDLKARMRWVNNLFRTATLKFSG